MGRRRRRKKSTWKKNSNGIKHMQIAITAATANNIIAHYYRKEIVSPPKKRRSKIEKTRTHTLLAIKAERKKRVKNSNNIELSVTRSIWEDSFNEILYDARGRICVDKLTIYVFCMYVWKFNAAINGTHFELLHKTLINYTYNCTQQYSPVDDHSRICVQYFKESITMATAAAAAAAAAFCPLCGLRGNFYFGKLQPAIYLFVAAICNLPVYTSYRSLPIIIIRIIVS